MAPNYPHSEKDGDPCDYCGRPFLFCPCGLLIHWDDGGKCPNCGVMPPPPPDDLVDCDACGGRGCEE